MVVVWIRLDTRDVFNIAFSELLSARSVEAPVMPPYDILNGLIGRLIIIRVVWPVGMARFLKSWTRSQSPSGIKVNRSGLGPVVVLVLDTARRWYLHKSRVSL